MRIIAHFDMDAFFAAIEERDKPRLKGRPIVVGADPKEGRGRGVVSTANYQAREYGIFSATPISKAWELSEKARKKGKPAAVFISGNWQRYVKVSKNIMTLIEKTVHSKYRANANQAPPEFSIEKSSIDEVYLDVSFTGSYKRAEELCKKIKNEIKKREKLTCSIGIGPNKLIAKIASDFKKPGGLTVVTEKEAGVFLEPLPIRRIPGIGPKTENYLHQRGIKTVKNLKKFSRREMEKMLGKWGISLYEKSRGLDDSPVGEYEEAKSIGEQETFSKDTLDPTSIVSRMKFLAAAVFRRFQKSGFKNFRTIIITVRFVGFITKTRSRTLAEPKNDLKTLEFEALRLLYPFFDQRENPQRKLIRLIGVRIEKLIA